MSNHLSVLLGLALLAAACGDKDGGDADGDGLDSSIDCDDLDAAIGLPPTWYGDADGDGAAGELVVVEACVVPTGYSEAATDCDDLDATVHPGALEVCDDGEAVDNDCDGLVDEADDSWEPGTGSDWYTDEDGDGYGVDGSETVLACSGDTTLAGDCDDTDDSLSPETIWYGDFDEDGYGAEARSYTGCEAPDDGESWLREALDCDDTDARINPDATEVCDARDNDCDGAIDDADDDLETATQIDVFVDDDGDGYGAEGSAAEAACAPTAGWSATDDDCDDDDVFVNPGVDEVCNDGIDNDCDGGAGPCAIVGELSGLEDADLHLRGITTGDGAGSAVAAVDLNGDGLDELLVGAPSADEGGSSSGEVYIVYGVVSGDPEQSLGDAAIFAGGTSFDALGQSIASAGDLDADGFEDVVIGAAGADPDDSSKAGEAYVLYGGTSAWSGTIEMSTAADVLVSGAASSDELGAAVHGVGDHDQDGFDDLLLAAVGAGEDAGAVYLLFGSPSLGSEHAADGLLTFSGAEEGDQLGGRDGLGSGDLNGDGYIDLVLGAYGVAAALVDGAGAVYIFDGDGTRWTTDPLASSADHTVRGGTALGDGRFGYSLAATDLDADGYDDLAVGAYYADTPDSKAGGLYLYRGSVSGLSGATPDEAVLSVVGDNTQDYLGRDVSGVGDLDGDGLQDLGFGAYGWDGATTNGGGAFVLLGSTSSSGTLSTADLDTIVGGDDSGMNLGYSVAGGDVDGDGYDDLFVGTLYDDDLTGGALLFYGGGL